LDHIHLPRASIISRLRRRGDIVGGNYSNVPKKGWTNAMSQPKSLLQMAGAPLEPSPLREAAIVMIDCQCEYLSGALPLAGIEPALDACAQLLDRARNAGAPIIHIAHKGRAGGPFDRDAEGGRIEARAAPRKGEIVIEKLLPNGFAGTALAETLEQTGRKQLIMGGFMTHMCVSSTVRAALDLGYRTTVVANATATRDLPGPAGEVVAAAALQTASLAALGDRFAVVASGADALS
jgi:nicotinamidase-related amidase